MSPPFLSPEDKAALFAPRGGRSSLPLPAKSSRATNLTIFRLVLDSLKNGPLHILDLGCGSGSLLQQIADHYHAQGWNPEEYLLGIDMDEDFFQANVPFQVADLAKPLNLQLRRFDIIIALEVLEHVRSVYQLLEETYATLNPGGRFLFSVPNMMSINSRFRFLFAGQFQYYPGPSSDPSDANWGVGHINPLPIQYWDYGLRYAGFTDIRYRTERIKHSALLLAAFCSPLLPFLWLGKYLLRKTERRFSERVYLQNLRPFREINSFRNLTGRGLVAECTKPNSADSPIPDP